MISLGIESTAHTFGCAVIEMGSKGNELPKILSDVRASYTPPEGSGIHPREASRLPDCDRGRRRQPQSLPDRPRMCPKGF